MVLTFFIVMFVLMMNFVWRYIDELVGKGLDFSVIMELLFYGTAFMLPMGIPLATLLAGIMSMGNLGENYELLAMKSAGMSLLQILKPLIVVVVFIAIGSFFAANNLVPYSNKKMQSIIYDIRQQKQVLEFKDGIFFNGLDNMSIRVGHQDKNTGELFNVLIYDMSNGSGNMQTTIADRGFIRLSDDKKYLLVTLYDGETYETTRNYQWANKNNLRHHIFKKQDATIRMDGYNFEHTDTNMFSNSQTKTVTELEHDIDSLTGRANIDAIKSYERYLSDYLFRHDNSLLGIMDTVKIDYSYKKPALITDSINRLSIYDKSSIYTDAERDANESLTALSFNEDSAKEVLNQLYRSKVEWHRKVALPISVIIFFLIGAPLGAIIRRGGMGMPIVISVLFFVFYYIISMFGEKMAKEGTVSAFEGMWIASFILLPIAIYLTHKATNDSNLLDVEWYIMKYNKIKAYFTTHFHKHRPTT